MANGAGQRATLAQVSTIFKASINAARSSYDVKLTKKAEEWLKAARWTLMKRIELEAYDLIESVSRGNPLKLPDYAVDSSFALKLTTIKWHQRLDPYKHIFKKNLQMLLKDCGFTFTTNESRTERRVFKFYVRFPDERSREVKVERTLKGTILPGLLKMKEGVAGLSDGEFLDSDAAKKNGRKGSRNHFASAHSKGKAAPPASKRYRAKKDGSDGHRIQIGTATKVNIHIHHHYN